MQPAEDNSISLSDRCTTSFYYSYIAQWRLFPGPYTLSPLSCQLEGLVLGTAGKSELQTKYVRAILTDFFVFDKQAVTYCCVLSVHFETKGTQA